MPPSQAKLLIQAAVAGLLVFGLAFVSIQLTRDSGRIASLWPVNAILLTFLLRHRPAAWPVLLTGGLIGNVASNFLVGDDSVRAVGLALCNTVEVAVAAAILDRVGKGRLDLDRQRDLVAFTLVCPLAGGISALLSGGALALLDEAPVAPGMMVWMLADSLGLFILTPALLILSRRENRLQLLAKLKRGSMAAPLLVAALIPLSALGPWHSAYMLSPPLLMIMAVELQTAGAAAGLLLVAIGSLCLSLAGYPPEALGGDAASGLLRLQVFLSLTALTILPLGSMAAQRNRMREALALAAGRAEAAAAAKSEFLANMSHELRTPLTSIIGFASLLREDRSLTGDQGRFVRRISDASQALLAVINDVLDFSKLEAGEVELDVAPAAPGPLIRQTAGLVSLQAEAKGLDLWVELDPALPDWVTLDGGRFRQILLNLLSNAVKFTPAGEVRVAAAYLPASAQLEVTVADTGPGVPADRLDRLFQRFSQADGSISRRFGGTGLGLAICKGLVELMGGAIGVRTAAGQGSAFTFTLAAPVTAAPATLTIEEPPPPAEGPCRILLVDDAPANRDLARIMLESVGLSVFEAVDGEAAVTAAEKEAFDVILMDVRMPGLDGMAATRRIRGGLGPNLAAPILALTADVQPSDVEACRAAGMDDHIAKPVSAAELISKTMRWAASRRPTAASVP